MGFCLRTFQAELRMHFIKRSAFYACFTTEIIQKQLFASGSVIMLNIHLDFVSVNIHQ